MHSATRTSPQWAARTSSEHFQTISGSAVDSPLHDLRNQDAPAATATSSKSAAAPAAAVIGYT